MTRTARTPIAALVVLLLLAGPTQAQPASPTARPTKIEPVDRSMAQLLDDGYEITSMNAGLAGFGFVLRRGKQWVLCTIGTIGEAPHAQPTSDCGKLN